MSKVKVVTDSTASLPPFLIDKYQITVIPLSLVWDGQSYLDGVDITPQEFYDRLQNSDSLPTTSQPSVSQFADQFRSLLSGDHEVIAILISSKISGTVRSAQQAKHGLETKAISVVDSLTSGMALGLHVLAVAEAAHSGASLEECTQLAERARSATHVYFAVDTLEFLHRGGRIGGAKRFMGTMLGIKPILEMREGRIEAVDQVRTQRKAAERILQLVDDTVSRRSKMRLAVMHANAPQRAKSLLTKAEKSFPANQAFLSDLSPVLGTHVGPGTLALASLQAM